MGALWIVVGALLAPVAPGGWATVAALALASALPIVALVRGLGGRAYPSALVRLAVLRPFWYVQLLLPLLAAAGFLGALAGAPFGAAGAAGRWVMLVVAAIFVVGAIAGYVGTRRLVVRRLDARIVGLPEALEGLRIVQLSDLHVGPHTPRRHLARIARETARAQPELIAITGDQVDDFARDVAHFAAAFGGLSAPLGVHAIPGNHDVYAGWSGVRAGLEGMGIRVLVNESVRLERDGAPFWLAGTGDPAGKSRGGQASPAPDVERTMSGIPSGSVAVVLAHNPALWPAIARRAARAGVRTLTLSGHTHHGQLSIPRLGWSLASPFLEHAMGAHADSDALLYINPGTNYWGIPFRIGALPEVTVLSLRRAEDGEAAAVVPTDERARPATRCRPARWGARRSAA
jgi:predicted MPP superfamily phosphohydrolase